MLKKLTLIFIILFTQKNIQAQLVEFCDLPPNVQVEENTGLRIVGNKICLDLTAEDEVLMVPHQEIIRSQQEKGLPTIFALCKTKIPKTTITKYSLCNAEGLNKFIFEEDKPILPFLGNRYKPADLRQKQFIDYKRRPLEDTIDYYLIDNPTDRKANPLGTHEDLLINDKTLMQLLFRACLNNRTSLYNLGAQLLKEKRPDLAIEFFELAADQNIIELVPKFPTELYKTGKKLSLKNDLALAKDYFKLAADLNKAREGDFFCIVI